VLFSSYVNENLRPFEPDVNIYKYGLFVTVMEFFK